MPGIFFRNFAGVLATTLSIVYQQYLHQKNTPNMWKQATIIPVYKGKREKASAFCYLSISLMNIAFKLLKFLVSNAIKSIWLIIINM